MKPRLAILSGFLAAVALITLQQILMGSHWETNDDVGHVLVVSGLVHCPRPDEHLLVPSIWLSLFWKELYSRVPAFPWYFVTLLTVHALSTMSFYYLLFKRLAPVLAVITALIFFTLVEIPLLTSLQFTSTAIISGLVAGMLLLSWTENEHGNYFDQKLLIILSSLLIFFSASLRANCAYLSIMLVAACVAFKLVAELIRFKRDAACPHGLRRTIFSICLLIGALLFSIGLNRLTGMYMESDQRWREYFKSIPALVRIVDWTGLPIDPESSVLKQLNWTSNDVRMLQNFLYADPDRFSAKQILKAGDLVGVLGVRQDLSPDYVVMQVKAIGKDRRLYPVLLMTLFLLPFLNSKLIGQGRFLAMVFVLCGILLFIVCFMRLPARVYFPVLSFPLMISIACIDGGFITSLCMRIRENHWRMFGSGSITAILIFFLLRINYSVVWHPHTEILARRAALQNALANLSRQERYIIFGNGLPYELLSPSEDLRKYFGGLKCLAITNYINSPLFAEQKKYSGIYSLKSGLTEPGITIISNDWLNQIMISYLKEHEAVEIVLETEKIYDQAPLLCYKSRVVK